MFRKKPALREPYVEPYLVDPGETWEQEIERRFHALETHIQELAQRMNDVAALQHEDITNSA